MEDPQKYFKILDQAEEIILDILYKYDKENILFPPERIKKELKEIFNEKYKEKLKDSVFNSALSRLEHLKYVTREEFDIPPEKREKRDEKGNLISYREKHIFLKITPRGITRAMNKELYESVDEAKKSIAEVERQVGEKFDSTVLYMENIKKDVTQMRNDIETIRKEFYGRILEIFGIFVSIFAFIIVGFTQITTLVNPGSDWVTNFVNVSAVYVYPVGL